MNASIRYGGICLALFVLLLLAGCGGGGGGGGTGGGGIPAPDPTVPPQPGEILQVVRAAPAVDATGVDEDTAIELDFDAPLDTASLPAQPLIVRDEMGDVAGTTTYVAAQNRLRFVPDQPLALGMHVRARTAAGLEDVHGNRRNDEFEWAFDTRLPQVDAGPSPYEAETESARLSAFEINQAGQGWVVYVRGEQFSANDLVAKRYGAPISAGRYVLRQAVAIAASEEGLDVNASGAAVLAFTEDLGTHKDAYAYVWNPVSQSWSGRIAIETSSAYDVNDVKAILSDTGDILVVCSRRPAGGGDYRLWARAYRAGIGWTGAQLIDAGLAPTGTFEMAINASGDALIAWDEYVPGEARVYGRTWSAAQGFGALVPVASQATVDHYLRHVLLDEDGYGYVAYRRRAGTTEKMYLRRYVPQGEIDAGWKQQTPLTNVSADSIATTRAVLGTDGAVNFGLMHRKDGVYSLFAARYQRGVGTSIAYPLVDDPEEAFSERLQIAAGPAGRATYVYAVRTNNDDLQVRASTYVPEQGWQAPVVVVDLVAPYHFDHMSLAARPTGDVYALVRYERDNAAHDELLLGRWIPADGLPGPVDEVSTAPGLSMNGTFLQLDGMGHGSALWGANEPPDVRRDIFERKFQ